MDLLKSSRTMEVKLTQKLSMHTLHNPRENVLLMTPKAIGHFISYSNVTSGDEDALKAAVAGQGVVSVATDAFSFMFQLYRHGVFSKPLCKN